MSECNKSRIDTIETFLQSGETLWKLSVEDGENIHHVRIALCAAIRARPYFKKRCECFVRKGQIYLVRTD